MIAENTIPVVGPWWAQRKAEEDAKISQRGSSLIRIHMKSAKDGRA